jgi:hypothetical protein
MSTIDPTDTFLGLDADRFTPPMAKAVLAFSVSERVKDRSAALADKANFGTITADEQAEYEPYIDLAEMLAIMKSRANRFLAAQSEDVLQNPTDEDTSHSSGRPVVFGDTATGRHLMVVYEQIDSDTVYPVTAYEVPQRQRP